jgi:CHASE2 domain-containing sensor protein
MARRTRRSDKKKRRKLLDEPIERGPEDWEERQAGYAGPPPPAPGFLRPAPNWRPPQKGAGLDPAGLLQPVEAWTWLAAVFGVLIGVHLYLDATFWNHTYFQTRLPDSRIEAPQGMVLVALDEAFAESYGYPDVVPQAYLVRLLEQLGAYDPAVVAIDLKLIPADTLDSTFADLRRVLDALNLVVLPSLIGEREELTLEPPRPLRASVQSGFVTFTSAPLSRTVARSGDPVPVAEMQALARLADGCLMPSFALVAAAVYRGHVTEADDLSCRVMTDARAARMLADLGYPGVRAGAEPAEGVRAGTTPRLINYRGSTRQGAWLPVESAEVIVRGESEASLFKDRLVLVGATYPERDHRDTFSTPFGLVRGVEVHAAILQQLLTRAHLGAWQGGWRSALVVAGLLALVGAAAWWGRLSYAGLLAVAVLVLLRYLALAWLVFSLDHRLLPLAGPVWWMLFAVLVSYAGYYFRGRARAAGGRPYSIPVSRTTRSP